ncbi:MAG: RrF2 family transcriptional regulator [Elusimicrobia bacterium]|nr:RrF2 family transcriptional regulator [Elusimicrobiota bacterium]
MKLSTRTRYGTRAAVELASCYHRGVPLSLKDISLKQNIPLKYLAKIMNSLKTAGLVKTLRGASGGFVLARAPQEISVADIFNYFEGSIVPKECNPSRGERMCKRYSNCATAKVWAGLESTVSEYLQKIKIGDLAKDSVELNKPALF